MKKLYETPSIKMVELVQLDIITASPSTQLKDEAWTPSTEGSTGFDEWLK